MTLLHIKHKSQIYFLSSDISHMWDWKYFCVCQCRKQMWKSGNMKNSLKSNKELLKNTKSFEINLFPSIQSSNVKKWNITGFISDIIIKVYIIHFIFEKVIYFYCSDFPLSIQIIQTLKNLNTNQLSRLFAKQITFKYFNTQ